MLFKSIAYPRWIILLVAWSVCLPMLLLITLQERFNPAANFIQQRKDILLSRTDFGGFSYARWEPEHDGRPLHYINFNNLRIENSNVGIFKTAMSREMVFEGLKLQLHNYGRSSVAEVFGSVIKDLTGTENSSSKQITGRLLSCLKRYPQVLPAARNVTGLRIKGFDYELFHGGEPWLSVTSAKAEFSGRDDEMVLHGRVVVKSNNGRTLRANRIRWNIIENEFRVRGIYALDCEQKVISGRDAFFDEELYSANTQEKLHFKERGIWCARLLKDY